MQSGLTVVQIEPEEEEELAQREEITNAGELVQEERSDRKQLALEAIEQRRLAFEKEKRRREEEEIHEENVVKIARELLEAVSFPFLLLIS